MSPVSLVTIHHEGAGAPTDVARGADGGYCYWIGVTRWTRLRAPVDNWATLGFNGKDLTICLSGNRMVNPVTDSDIALIHGAFLDCLHRDEIVDEPVVRAHRNSPGSMTVCPGDLTMLRWPAIVAACRPTDVPPKPKPEVKVKPRFDPPLELVDKYADPAKGSWGLQRDGGIITFSGGFFGSMVGNPHFAGRVAARLVKPGEAVSGANPPLAHYGAAAVYEVIAESGERYIPIP